MNAKPELSVNPIAPDPPDGENGGSPNVMSA